MTPTNSLTVEKTEPKTAVSPTWHFRDQLPSQALNSLTEAIERLSGEGVSYVGVHLMRPTPRKGETSTTGLPRVWVSVYRGSVPGPCTSGKWIFPINIDGTLGAAQIVW